MSSFFATPLEKTSLETLMNDRFLLKILSPSMWDISLHGHVNNNNTSGRYNLTTFHIRWPNSLIPDFPNFLDLVQQQEGGNGNRWGQVSTRTSAHARETFSARVAALTPSVPHPALSLSLCNSFVSPLPSYRLDTHTVRSRIFFSRDFLSPSPFLFIFPIALHLCHPRPLCTHGRSW